MAAPEPSTGQQGGKDRRRAVKPPAPLEGARQDQTNLACQTVTAGAQGTIEDGLEDGLVGKGPRREQRPPAVGNDPSDPGEYRRDLALR